MFLNSDGGLLHTYVPSAIHKTFDVLLQDDDILCQYLGAFLFKVFVVAVFQENFGVTQLIILVVGEDNFTDLLRRFSNVTFLSWFYVGTEKSEPVDEVEIVVAYGVSSLSYTSGLHHT